MEQRTRTRDLKRQPGKRGGPGSGKAPASGGGSDAASTSGDRGGAGSGGGGRRPQGKRGSAPWKPILAGVAAAAVAVAIGFGLFAGGGGDTVSADETASRQASYQALVASGGLALRPVPAADLDAAIESLPETVEPEQREALRERVNEGAVRLAWLTVWDTHAEDGDILRFESSGSFPIDVTALNAPTTIAIPYPADGNVLVTGVKDGGGGITIALRSGAAEIAWPTMAPGDTLNLPVTPGF